MQAGSRCLHGLIIDLCPWLLVSETQTCDSDWSTRWFPSSSAGWLCWRRGGRPSAYLPLGSVGRKQPNSRDGERSERDSGERPWFKVPTVGVVELWGRSNRTQPSNCTQVSPRAPVTFCLFAARLVRIWKQLDIFVFYFAYWKESTSACWTTFRSAANRGSLLSVCGTANPCTRAQLPIFSSADLPGCFCLL